MTDVTFLLITRPLTQQSFGTLGLDPPFQGSRTQRNALAWLYDIRCPHAVFGGGVARTQEGLIENDEVATYQI